MKSNIKKISDNLKGVGRTRELIIGFSDKSYGQMKFSAGNRQQVLVNRENFFSDMGIAGRGILVRANQVHSNRNYWLENKDIQSGCNRFSKEIEIKNTDGLITDLKEVWLAITVADCVPVLIWDKDFSVVAAVHAGWQGTLVNITRKAVEKITEKTDINPAKLQAWIGPSIGPDDFEVQDDIWLPFKRKFDNQQVFIKKNNKKYIDLWQINADQLINQGLKENNIFISGESSYSLEKYYSYRRGDSARMMAVIGINS